MSTNLALYLAQSLTAKCFFFIFYFNKATTHPIITLIYLNLLIIFKLTRARASSVAAVAPLYMASDGTMKQFL